MCVFAMDSQTVETILTKLCKHDLWVTAMIFHPPPPKSENVTLMGEKRNHFSHEKKIRKKAWYSVGAQVFKAEIH